MANPTHTKKLSTIQQVDLNEFQAFLYKRAIRGLSIYSDDVIAKLSPEKIEQIKSKHERCRKVLNLWKHQLINETYLKYFRGTPVDRCLNKNFPYVSSQCTDEVLEVDISFTMLGIKKADVIDKLIKTGILHYRFYELTQKSKYSKFKKLAK